MVFIIMMFLFNLLFVDCNIRWRFQHLQTRRSDQCHSTDVLFINNLISLSKLSLAVICVCCGEISDPSNSHSVATIRVCSARGKGGRGRGGVGGGSILARDLLSFSRVQNQVAKSAVLASLASTTNVTVTGTASSVVDTNAAASSSLTSTSMSLLSDDMQIADANDHADANVNSLVIRKDSSTNTQLAKDPEVVYLVVNFHSVSDRL